MYLDGGCAEGLYTRGMAKRAEFALGIDISLQRPKTTRKESMEPNVEHIRADWDYMLFQNDSFDIVLFSEGPERPSDPIVTLGEINRVSKMNGYLSISAPICPKYVFIAESTEGFLKLTSKLKLPFRVPRKTLIAHKNVFSPSLLKKLVRPVGFKLEKCTLNPRPLGNLRVFSCSMILARKIGAARAVLA